MTTASWFPAAAELAAGLVIWAAVAAYSYWG